jgi:hypothetical protein
MMVMEGCKGVEGGKDVELLRSQVEHHLYRYNGPRWSIRAVVCAAQAKGLKSLKSLKSLKNLNV